MMITQEIDGSVLTETEVISDVGKIKETLLESHRYRALIVEYQNAKCTRGKCTPIQKVVYGDKVTGNQEKTKWCAYENSTKDGQFFFFELEDILSVQISTSFYIDPTDKEKLSDMPVKKELMIFFNN